MLMFPKEPFGQILLISKTGGLFWNTGNNCRTEFDGFGHSRAKSSGYVVIVAGSQKCPILSALVIRATRSILTSRRRCCVK